MDLSKLDDNELQAIVSGNMSALSDNALKYIASGGKNSYVVAASPTFNASPDEVKRMQREFLRKEGTLASRVRNTPVSEMAYNAAMEVPRLAQEAVTVPISSALKGAYGLGALAKTGGALIRGKSLDDALNAGTQTMQGYSPITGPMESSITGDVIGTGITSASDALENATGNTGFASSVIQAGADILGLVGGGKVLSKAGPMAIKSGQSAIASGANGLSNILTNWVGNKPVERVVRTLKASTLLDTAEKEAIANTLLEHGIVGEIAKKEGTIALENKIAARENKMGEVIDIYANQDATVPVLPIVQALQSLKNTAIKSADWKERLGQIDSAIENIQSNPLAKNGQIPVDAAHAMKIDLGKKASWGEYTDFQNKIRQVQNLVLGEEISKVAPEIKQLNAELAPMYQALLPLARAESRLSNLESGLSLKQTSHGNLGTLGKIYGAIKGVTESNSISPLIAQGMYNLKSELNPVVKPNFTMPDILPLPPRPDLIYDPSTGLRTTGINNMPARIPLDNSGGGAADLIYDPLVGHYTTGTTMMNMPVRVPSSNAGGGAPYLVYDPMLRQMVPRKMTGLLAD